MEIVYIILAVTVIFFICNKNGSSNLKTVRKEFMNGMWSRDSDDTYLYIDPNTKKSGFNNGYIVRSDKINEPIEIKILYNKGAIELEFKGTDSIKPRVKPQINIGKGTITIADKDGSPLTLKKDN